MELGSKPVVSINDNERAQIIAAKLPILLPLLLARTFWNFAIKYVFDNTPLTVGFSPDFQYSYQLPADYGRFWRFSTNYYPLAYQITDGLLLINIRPVSYYYVVDTVPYNVISPLFYRSLALYAASDTAYVLTEDEGLAKYLLQKYENESNSAILLNDMERDIVTMPQNDFDRQIFI